MNINTGHQVKSLSLCEVATNGADIVLYNSTKEMLSLEHAVIVTETGETEKKNTSKILFQPKRRQQYALI